MYMFQQNVNKYKDTTTFKSTFSEMTSAIKSCICNQLKAVSNFLCARRPQLVKSLCKNLTKRLLTKQCQSCSTASCNHQDF